MLEKKRLIFCAILGMIMLLSVGVKLYLERQDPNFPVPILESEESPALKLSEDAKANVIVIDISGQVVLPGVYTLKEGSRVYDAVEIAGGLKEDADRAFVNLAERLEDETKIFIPKLPVNQEGEKDISTTQVDLEKVNINIADVNRLKELSGVGDSLANAIIEYRTINGKFKKLEDFKNVSGIGEKSFEKLKDKISIY